VLSTRVNKSDPHDAEGLAQLARTGWYKAVHIKDSATHMDRAQLAVREQLIKARRAMLGQLRGLLKLFGLRLGKVTTPGKRTERLEAVFEQKPELRDILTPLTEALVALEKQVGRSSRALASRAAADPVCQRLTSVPGVGPITAFQFKSSVEDPKAVRARRGGRRLCRPGAQAIAVGRAGRQGPHIQGRRRQPGFLKQEGCIGGENLR
jgi:transposase